jgi:tRNA-splicing ligase RtcB (3'-phosphate/5'-hydroxy nucleic acid ligase)
VHRNDARDRYPRAGKSAGFPAVSPIFQPRLLDNSKAIRRNVVTIQLSINKARVPVHIWTRDIDEKSITQLTNTANLPFVFKHVAAMPDVHLGIGATVGSVVATQGAIVPASVGVDIGCGMIALRTTLNAGQLPDSLAKLRSAIEARVPVGMDFHNEKTVRRDAVHDLKPGYIQLTDKYPELAEQGKNDARGRWARQIGSLGGGNHFVEICLDESGRVWAMLHSGSRGIGNRIGQFFIAKAREEMLKQDIRLPDRDLAYLTENTQSYADYVQAVDWAQSYAALNRREMMTLVIEAMRSLLPAFELETQAINCHHNYVARESHFGESVLVTRKGAIRAGVGDLGIVPGSMGAKSFIVRGKGNVDSFHSCSHGAGRRFSRTQARKQFSREDLVEQTKGVECRKDLGVLDEAPGAYKDIDTVMANQTDLVEVVHTLKQVVCVKG